MIKLNAAQVQTAIDRLPRQSNASIVQVLANARRLEIEALAHACQDELRTRGSLTLNATEAEEACKISARVTGKALSEIIEIAFTEVPPKPEEYLILRWISQHPGGSHAELAVAYGKRDLSLVIGHLVYYRFGYFKPFLTNPIQSDLLLERDNTSGKMCYSLRSEASQAYSNLGIFELAA